MSDTTTDTKGSEPLRSRLLDFADTQISELFDAVFPKVSHVVGRVLQLDVPAVARTSAAAVQEVVTQALGRRPPAGSAEVRRSAESDKVDAPRK